MLKTSHWRQSSRSLHQGCARRRTATAPSRQTGLPYGSGYGRGWPTCSPHALYSSSLRSSLLRGSSCGRDGGDAAAAAVRASRRYRSHKLAIRVGVATTVRLTKPLTRPRTLPRESLVKARRAASLGNAAAYTAAPATATACATRSSSTGTRALVPIRNGTMDTRKLGSCLHVARRNEMRGRRTWTDTCRTTTKKHASD